MTGRVGAADVLAHALEHASTRIAAARYRRSDGGLTMRCQAVPVAMHGVNESRMMGVHLNLLAEPCHGRVDGSREGCLSVTPQVLQQLVAVDHVSLSLREIVEDFEFLVCQPKIRVVAYGRPCPEIDRDRSHRQYFKARTCAPQDGADTGEQLFEIEWLGQIVVGAVVQAPN